MADSRLTIDPPRAMAVCAMAYAVLAAAFSGCGKTESGHEVGTAQVAKPPRAGAPAASPAMGRTAVPPRRARAKTSSAAAPAGDPEPRRSLADLLKEDDGQDNGPASPAPTPGRAGGGRELPIDDTKAAVAGIRKLTGKHIALYTDVLPAPAVDELPAVFDAAVPAWCAYFQIDPRKVTDWHMVGFLMQDKQRFQTAGMLPPQLPPFENGYQQGHNLWLYDQPDDYYRRHLLLHEGTHGFMDLVVGGKGPPWYAEGMAELLGTHRWQDGRLALGYMPAAKTETPGWGRIRIVKDQLAAGRGMMPDQILAYGPNAHLRNAPYGWCWALAAFFDAHPQYQKTFRALRARVRSPGLTEWFRDRLRDRWPEICEEWQVFVMNIEYGYDIARAAVMRKPVQPLPAAGATVRIAADRGWQSTGIRLAAGATYRIEASGRYQIRKTEQVWWCEPGGVTIHYYQHRPLGLLLGAIRDEQQPLEGLTPLAHPEPIGLERELTPPSSGTLYLKINESAADLADNQGDITVTIRRTPG